MWVVLAELSYLFRQFCAKEISRSIIDDLEKAAPVLICKLEKIFPPGFFTLMLHLIVHLPNEVRMGGPVHCRWCYPVERNLKTLRKEVSNFTEQYYSENLPSVHNAPPRYNAGESESSLSLFRGQQGAASGSTVKQLNYEEWRKIMLYVLTNLDEVQPYMG
jgi:hypothetical protein